MTLSMALRVLCIGSVIFVGGCEKVQSVTDGGPADSGLPGRNCDGGIGDWREESIGDAAIATGSTQPANLLDVWGFTGESMWAVGGQGTIVHYDGTTWERQESGVTGSLNSIWGAAPDDLWAVGQNGVVLHYTGQSWEDGAPPASLFAPPPDAGVGEAIEWPANLNAVFGTTRAQGTDTVTDELFVVGDRGLVLRWRLNVWTIVDTNSPEQLSGVWAASNDRVFVVGDFGTVLVGNASGFAPAQTNTSKALKGVWGRSANEVYVVGLSGTILYYDGGGGLRAIEGAPKQFFRDIWGPPSDGGTHYVVGWDGAIITMIGSPPYASGAEFAASECATLRRLDGIWGTMVEPTLPDGGPLEPSDAGVDVELVPRAWIAGASGAVVTGP